MSLLPVSEIGEEQHNSNRKSSWAISLGKDVWERLVWRVAYMLKEIQYFCHRITPKLDQWWLEPRSLGWRKRVWSICFERQSLRQTGERLKAPCVTPTIKHGGGSAMVWGCFAGGKSMGLVWSKGYHDEGKVPLHPPAWCSSIGTKTRGSSLFCSKIMIPRILPSSVGVTETKKKKKRKVFFRKMVWPPQSPDLSLRLSLCGMSWIDQSGKRVPRISSLSLMNLWKLGMQFLAHTLKNLWDERLVYTMLLLKPEVTLKRAKSKQEKPKNPIIILKMFSAKWLFIW